MQAIDIMTKNVETVTPDTTVEDIARIFLRRHISAVPVVDEDGALRGIVSEGDLMRRSENDTERKTSWWLHLVTSPAERAQEFVTTHGHRARDVMTTDVVTIAEDTPVSQIAEMIERYRIKRVPVMRDGKVVGIVSRANLLHGLVSLAPASEVQADDRQIREALAASLAEELPGVTTFVSYVVKDGVVRLWGGVMTDAEHEAVRVVAENVAGVVRVEDNVSVMPSNLHLMGTM